MKTQNYILYLLLAFSMMACSPSQLDKMEYVKYVEDEDNGLKVKKVIEDMTFEFQYKPIPYLLLQTRSTMAEKELQGFEYYTLTVYQNSGTDILGFGDNEGELYNSKMAYLLNDMKNDIKLIVGTDTISCDDFHLERGMESSSKARFIFSFPTKFSSNQESKNLDRQISLNDKLFGTGKLNVRISSESINNIPELVYEKEFKK